MSTCKFPERWLHAWVDNEPCQEAFQAQEHMEKCQSCTELVESWRRAGAKLRSLVDEGVGPVEPLLALQNIRARIAQQQEMSLGQRAVRMWQDLWLFHKRSLAGLAVAAAMGALIAPGVVYVLGQRAVPGGMAGSGAVLAHSSSPGASAASVKHAEPALATTWDVRLQVILGHQRGTTIAPELLQALRPLGSLPFTAYELEQESSLHLASHGSIRFQLPRGLWVTIRVQEALPDGRLQINMLMDEPRFEAVVWVAPGATAAALGPRLTDGTLLLVVSRLP